MNVGLREPLQKLIATHERGGHVLVLSDYDGTLVPLGDHPNHAVLPERTRHALIRLARTPRVFVGIFSGRSLSNLKKQVGISELYYAGTGGLEVDFGGNLVTHPQAGDFQPLLLTLADELEKLLLRHPGAWLEQKPLGLTVHYRAVPVHSQAVLFVELRTALASCGEQLRAVSGQMAVEITPALDWNKGTAVERFSRSIAPRQHTILYAGDYGDDLQAFEATRALGGITVGVGIAAPEQIDWRVPSPVALGELLDELATALVATRRRALFSSLWNWQIATLKCSDLKCF